MPTRVDFGVLECLELVGLQPAVLLDAALRFALRSWPGQMWQVGSDDDA